MNYHAINLGPFQFAVIDRITGALGRVWRSEREAIIDLHSLQIRNLQHS